MRQRQLLQTVTILCLIIIILLYLMRTAAILDIVDLYNRSTTLLTYAIGQLYPEEQQSAITVGPIVMAWFKLAIE